MRRAGGKHRPKPMGLPVYLSLSLVGRALGWSTNRVKWWLQRNDCAIFRDGRWTTTPELLRLRFPEVWDRLMSEFGDEVLEGDEE